MQRSIKRLSEICLRRFYESHVTWKIVAARQQDYVD